MITVKYNDVALSSDKTFTNPLNVRVQGSTRTEEVSDPVMLTLEAGDDTIYENLVVSFTGTSRSVTWQISLQETGPFESSLAIDSLAANATLDVWVRSRISAGTPAATYRDASLSLNYDAVSVAILVTNIAWDLTTTVELPIGDTLIVPITFTPTDTTQRDLSIVVDNGSALDIAYDSVAGELTITGAASGDVNLQAEGQNGQVLSELFEVREYGNAVVSNPYAFVAFGIDAFGKANFRAQTSLDPNSTINSLNADAAAQEYFDQNYNALALTDINTTTWPYVRPDGLVGIPGAEWDPAAFTIPGTDEAFLVLFNPRSPGNNYDNAAPGDINALFTETTTDDALLIAASPGAYYALDNGAVPAVTLAKYVDWFTNQSHLLGIEVSSRNRYPEDFILWDELLKEFAPLNRLVLGFANDDMLEDTELGYSWNNLKLPGYVLDAASEATARTDLRASLESGEFTFSSVTSISTTLEDAINTAPVLQDLVVDEITRIATVTAEANSAAIDPADVQWIVDGQVVATGLTFDFGADADVRQYKYFRVQLIGDEATTYTQAVYTNFEVVE